MRGKTRQKAKGHVINMGAKILNKIQPNKIQKYEKSKKYSACWVSMVNISKGSCI